MSGILVCVNFYDHQLRDSCKPAERHSFYGVCEILSSLNMI